jgi:ATP-dependent Clp protease adaptor protein ClpS
MFVFSRNLSQSLSRAIAQAEQQSYPCATPEHILLALLDDPDTVPVLRACHVDIEKLRGAVLASMPHWPYTQDQDEPDDALDSDEPDETPESEESDDAPDEGEGIPVEHFQVVLRRAVDHAKSSGCEEVNSADVLVALLDRPVGKLLNEHGVTRYDATTFICHGISKDGISKDEISKDTRRSSRDYDIANRSGVHAPSGDATDPATYEVRLLNDNYTSMDFVVHVLKEVFDLEPEDAERVMLEVHRDGAGACGTFTREEAEARAARVMDLARQHQHPLRCRVLE